MADLVFLAITLGFFALCVLYVRACDVIVRSGHAERTLSAGEGTAETPDAGPMTAARVIGPR